MPLLGELINNLAQKAGIAADDAQLKALLSAPELAAIKVPDEISGAFDKGLLNIDAAKNNHPDIKRKYFADAFDGMDRQLIALVENDTFDDADVAEIKAEKSTVKKAELIVSKLKAAKASAKGADKDAINAQLTAAHEAARVAKAEVEAVKNEYEGKIKNIHTKSAKRGMFGKYKTIYDELPDNIRIATMESLIETALQDKQAELIADENGTLQLRSKDGSNVFGSNHVQLTPQSFFDQTLAPILKVTAAPAAPRQPNPAPATPGNGGDATNTGFLKSHMDQVLADMAAPQPSMM